MTREKQIGAETWSNFCAVNKGPFQRLFVAETE